MHYYMLQPIRNINTLFVHVDMRPNTRAFIFQNNVTLPNLTRLETNVDHWKDISIIGLYANNLQTINLYAMQQLPIRVTADTFCNLRHTQLYTLNISSCAIVEFDKDAFKCITNLSTIDISHNPLISSSRDYPLIIIMEGLKYTHVEYLYIDGTGHDGIFINFTQMFELLATLSPPLDTLSMRESKGITFSFFTQTVFKFCFLRTLFLDYAINFVPMQDVVRMLSIQHLSISHCALSFPVYDDDDHIVYMSPSLQTLNLANSLVYLLSSTLSFA